MRSATLCLPGTDARAPRRARAQVAETCGHAPADAVDDARLLTSELVSNALRHTTTGSITVSIDCDEDDIRVGVTDESSALPRRRCPPGAENGRGLYLLDALATAWGSEQRGREGKTVWFRLRFR
jgi:anti-sigma regulatory factor (Ser/Thr protein kinase)